MERDKIEQICSLFDSLDYTDKKEVFGRTFAFSYVTDVMNDKLVLISLVALTYKKMREKQPTITPLEVLLKITGESKSNSPYYKFLESLAITAEDFSYGCTTIDACGLTTSKDIINKIKELLSQWLPF